MRPQSSILPSSPSVIDLLVRLGRPDARLRRSVNETILEGGTSGSGHTVARTLLRAAEDAGFLVWAPLSPTEAKGTLSALGRQTLRQHLMAVPGAAMRGSELGRKARAHQGAGLRRDDSTSARVPLAARSVIEQLARRRTAGGQPLLTATQLSAARRFAAEFERAALQPRVTAQWSPAGAAQPRRRPAPDAMPDLAPDVLSAQQRVRTVLAALADTFGNLIMDVCGFDRGLEVVEAERGWPRHTTRFMLAGALDQLALHYGLTLCPRPEPGTIVQWGDGQHHPDRRAPLPR
jgi:Domain of unknown function (DUF6456)